MSSEARKLQAAKHILRLTHGNHQESLSSCCSTLLLVSSVRISHHTHYPILQPWKVDNTPTVEHLACAYEVYPYGRAERAVALTGPTKIETTRYRHYPRQTTAIHGNASDCCKSECCAYALTPTARDNSTPLFVHPASYRERLGCPDPRIRAKA